MKNNTFERVKTNNEFDSCNAFPKRFYLMQRFSKNNLFDVMKKKKTLHLKRVKTNKEKLNSKKK